MAEDDELAQLQRMQAAAEGDAWGQAESGSVEAGLLPHSDHSETVKEENIADDQVLRASSSSPSISGAISNGDSYDPASFNPNPVAAAIASQETSRPSSAASAPRPKTIGGFLADDSDDENYVPPPRATSTGLLQPGSAAPTRSATRSPLQTNVPQDLQPSMAHEDTTSLVPNAADIPSDTPANGNASEKTIGQQQNAQAQVAASTADATQPKARLPHDTAGILEDRIKEDPRGDLQAWLSLISEHRRRNKFDDARAVYERFFQVFPSAADMWIDYAEMELSMDNFHAAEQIFTKALLKVPNVHLWSIYLNYIRRRNDLTSDPSGSARATVSQAYDFVLDNVGHDRDSGKIWQEYVQFHRSAPGQIGGNSWIDQQKMDRLRKAYQRAICVPMSAVNALWKEYDQFEMGLNKMTGRKFLQERSPAYMTARTANTALDNITRGLLRTNLPRLPPALGFEGDQEYQQQVDIWKRWIQWEIEDPLVLKDDELDLYKKRVVHVYKQAVMALRFWPEIWVDAADWCFANGLEKEGNEFLDQGIVANPESCLLAFKKGDRLETVLPVEEGDEAIASRGAAVRAPYDKLLTALYDLAKTLKAREAEEIKKIENDASIDASIDAIVGPADEDAEQSEKDAKAKFRASKIEAVKKGYEMQNKLLSRTITFAWIALMRAMRRVQGKGKPGAVVGGSRQIFNDARAKGRITSDLYVVAALIEHHVYKEAVGTKIFDRGSKLFPEDEVFLLEYLKHLLSIGDLTNARVAFETSVNRLTQKPEKISKTRSLYSCMHKYESEYGDLSQIQKLEQRMAVLFPEDPKLARFASRHSADGFDPTAVRPIISPASQMKPKTVMQSVEQVPSQRNSPLPQYRQENSPRPMYPQPQQTHSPKRPFDHDSDNEMNRPRKLQRGESPLKGAAGRRLDQQKRLQQTQGTPQWQSNSAPTPIPRDITFLLSIIPRAELYDWQTNVNPQRLVNLLSQTRVPDYSSWRAEREQARRYDNGMTVPDMLSSESISLNYFELHEQRKAAMKDDNPGNDREQFPNQVPRVAMQGYHQTSRGSYRGGQQDYHQNGNPYGNSGRHYGSSQNKRRWQN